MPGHAGIVAGLPVPLAPLESTGMRLAPEDMAELEAALRRLEGPGLAVRLADALGSPVEAIGRVLPHAWQRRIDRAMTRAMSLAMNRAVASLAADPSPRATHRLLGGASGAIGGFFGLAALPVELPLSTVLMLRAIADIARREGEDLSNLDSRLACLTVFALGSPLTAGDDAAETGYWTSRIALGQMVSEAGRHIARHGVTSGGPAIAALIHALASRFGLALSAKASAQLVPIFGAAGGAALNLAFLAHFESVARGHFAVRRLERRHGSEMVRAAAEELSRRS
ncbi:MAG: EcsC family protein [Rhodothalassiaceae bacterium]